MRLNALGEPLPLIPDLPIDFRFGSGDLESPQLGGSELGAGDLGPMSPSFPASVPEQAVPAASPFGLGAAKSVLAPDPLGLGDVGLDSATTNE